MDHFADVLPSADYTKSTAQIPSVEAAEFWTTEVIHASDIISYLLQPTNGDVLCGWKVTAVLDSHWPRV